MREPRAGAAAYTPPQIEDHGSLTELTADFDLNFVGSVAKVLTLAVASAPMPGGGGDDGGVATEPTPQGEITELPEEGQDPLDPGDDGGVLGEQEDNNPRSGVLNEVESGGGIPAEGPTDAAGPGGAGPGGASDADGGLPFTGYAAWVAAAAGAAMTTGGVTLRRMLKRGD